MFRYFMPIAAAFAPNYTWGDFAVALRYYLGGSSRLLEGEEARKMEEDFSRYMEVSEAVSFDSGRAGFFAILKAMGIDKGDEVILQAFTTVALANVIRLVGAVPVYTDIDAKTLNMDPGQLETKINDKTRAIIIQHTFGNPAPVDDLLEIAARHGIKTIEDCAHSLGAEHRGIKTGKFADAAFFSFGRDKVISAVAGGMVVAKDGRLMGKIREMRDGLSSPSPSEVRKKLLHPIVTLPALYAYRLFSLGKAVMYLAFRCKLLDKAYTKAEKACELREDFARKMPNALAAIAVRQLRKADAFNAHRMEIAKIYDEAIDSRKAAKTVTDPADKNIYLWYTVMVEDKEKVIARAREKDIILGDWFPQAVGPMEVDLEKAGYAESSCPVAEKISRHCVNLPTHHNIREEDAWKVAGFINSF